MIRYANTLNSTIVIIIYAFIDHYVMITRELIHNVLLYRSIFPSDHQHPINDLLIIIICVYLIAVYLLHFKKCNHQTN